jgi:acetyltransferase-like isoleucine patch superfamily enzyme
MSGSGLNKQRMQECRKALHRLFHSDEKRVTVDISNLSHRTVGSIMYGSVFNGLLIVLRYSVAITLRPFPGSWIKKAFYRLCGVRIGRNVYISPFVYIDVLRPSLITVGDNVIIGMGASLMTHERSMRTLSVGRVVIGDDVTIGGLVTIRCGVTVGCGAEIDMQAVITRDVAPNTKVFTRTTVTTTHGNDF